jgi:hypothetical protein
MILKYATKKWGIDLVAMILQMGDVVYVVRALVQIEKVKNGSRWGSATVINAPQNL